MVEDDRRLAGKPSPGCCELRGWRAILVEACGGGILPALILPMLEGSAKKVITRRGTMFLESLSLMGESWH